MGLGKLCGKGMNWLRGIILSAQGLPIVLTLSILGILLVLFRMKSVEVDYQITETEKEIKRIEVENKELKAQRARLLSVKNLKNIAQKYDLKQPEQEQIIVIP